jgi:hypothetical protein
MYVCSSIRTVCASIRTVCASDAMADGGDGSSTKNSACPHIILCRDLAIDP